MGTTPRSKVAGTTQDGSATEVDGIADRRGAELPPGTIVGDYQIERKIGHGGMGSVYEAIHPVIEKRVAIKVLLPELSRNEESVERFKSEARAVNRIRHPSIVDVFGYGTTEDGRCFLVMELLDGESLGRRLQYDAPSVAEACDILISITHALDAAHATGIVHRDLKPDNVFLVEHKHVKLLDFGIAKLSAQSEHAPASTEYTQPGQAMGTPRYIAPEQARGDAVDGRTDIYSLGVMAFELLVGRLPFVGDNPMELIAKHITLPPPIPSDLAPTLPPAADKLLLQMLDKEPANRPALGQVRALLDEIRAPWVTSVTPRERKAPAPVVLAEPPEKRSVWLPVGLALGLAAAVGMFFVIRSLKTEDAVVEPSVVQPTPEPAAPAVKRPEVKPPEPADDKPVETKADVKPAPEPRPAQYGRPRIEYVKKKLNPQPPKPPSEGSGHGPEKTSGHGPEKTSGNAEKGSGPEKGSGHSPEKTSGHGPEGSGSGPENKDGLMPLGGKK